MITIPPAPRRRTRLVSLVTPLAVLVAVIVLLLLPNLFMHPGLHSQADLASPAGEDAAARSAAVESRLIMR